MQDEVKVSQADVVRALDRAIEQIMGIEIEAMNGDNLAVTLCSHFDDPDGGELDDNGWSQAATDAYDEIKAEIAGKFVPVREAIAAFARHRQQAERGVIARIGFQIGDRVKITAPDWEKEPPHYITGIDWHPKHGVTFTTSEVWPPKVEGFHVCGLTDEWRPEDLMPLPTPPEAV